MFGYILGIWGITSVLFLLLWPRLANRIRRSELDEGFAKDSDGTPPRNTP